MSLRAKQLEAIGDILNDSKHQAYKAAIDAALAKYPDDSELWLLRGNAEEPTAASRGQRGLVGAVAYYQAVLAISPDNPAAQHYLVHAYESIGHPEEAVKHGEIYARLCPSIPRAQNMYGHDLRVLGRNDEAIAQFRKADALELRYYETEKIPARYDWHRIHNLDLMAGSYEFKGQVKQADQLLREFFSLRGTLCARCGRGPTAIAFHFPRRQCQGLFNLAFSFTSGWAPYNRLCRILRQVVISPVIDSYLEAGVRCTQNA